MTGAAKAERILAEELARLQWTEANLAGRQKSHPVKLTLAARLRQETMLRAKQIAERLHLAKPKVPQDKPALIHEQHSWKPRRKTDAIELALR